MFLCVFYVGVYVGIKQLNYHHHKKKILLGLLWWYSG